MSIKIFNPTIGFLKNALNLRATRHSLIASNLANNDTPLYQAVDLAFEDQLQSSLRGNGNLTISRTSSRHLPISEDNNNDINGKIVLEPANRSGNDLNTVDLDREMSKLAQNTLLYDITVQMVAKKLALIRYSIEQGGR